MRPDPGPQEAHGDCGHACPFDALLQGSLQPWGSRGMRCTPRASHCLHLGEEQGHDSQLLWDTVVLTQGLKTRNCWGGVVCPPKVHVLAAYSVPW